MKNLKQYVWFIIYLFFFHTGKVSWAYMLVYSNTLDLASLSVYTQKENDF